MTKPTEQAVTAYFHASRSAAKKRKDNPAARAILERMVKRGVAGPEVLE